MFSLNRFDTAMVQIEQRPLESVCQQMPGIPEPKSYL
jgi:hypothetical protein